MWPPTSTEARWRRLIRYDLPVLLYAGLIFWLSAQSYTEAEKRWLRIISDHVLHALEYGVFALLLFRQLNHAGRIRSIWAAAALSLLVSMAYAATDEWHQSFVRGRHMDLRDWVADSVGAFLCLMVLAAYSLKKKKLTLQRLL